MEPVRWFKQSTVYLSVFVLHQMDSPITGLQVYTFMSTLQTDAQVW